MVITHVRTIITFFSWRSVAGRKMQRRVLRMRRRVIKRVFTQVLRRRRRVTALKRRRRVTALKRRRRISALKGRRRVTANKIARIMVTTRGRSKIRGVSTILITKKNTKK